MLPARPWSPLGVSDRKWGHGASWEALLPHLGARYMGPRGGNASSCTLDTCVLIHVYFIL